MNLLLKCPVRIGIAFLLTAMPVAAYAQTKPPTSPAVQDPSAVASDQGPPEGMGGDHFMIGVGVAYMPEHHGSDKFGFQPLPAIDIQFGPLFVNFRDGIGIAPIDNDFIKIGAGIVMMDGYEAKDVPRGVGKLNMGAGARGFVTLKQWGFEATVGATKGFVGSTKGFLVDASLSRPIIVTPKLMLMPSIGTTWADKKHNDRYFGINAQQSAASGLQRYTADSGFLDAKADLGAMYRLTDKITVGAIGGVTTLLGDAKDAPIVDRKTNPFGILFVGYSF